MHARQDRKVRCAPVAAPVGRELVLGLAHHAHDARVLARAELDLPLAALDVAPQATLAA